MTSTNNLLGDVNMTDCDEEPIRFTDSIQSFGCMVIVQEAEDGALQVVKASENCEDIIGLAPEELFSLGSFYDCLEEEQVDVLYNNLNLIGDTAESLQRKGPQVFLLSGILKREQTWKCWCAAHEMIKNESSKDQWIILEFEPATNDANNYTCNDSILLNQIKVRSDRGMVKAPYIPTQEQLLDSTEKKSKPLKGLSRRKASGRIRQRTTTTSSEESKRAGPSRLTVSSNNMQMSQLLNQVNDQLSSQQTLISLFKTTVGIMKDITLFTRATVYQFNKDWTGQVVAELVDDRITQDFFQGLHFPAEDIPKQARDLYTVNKVQMMFDREAKTAKIISKNQENTKLDMTFSFLRPMSSYHTLYLANMGVRSSISISITAFNRLWGLVILHYYGDEGKRISFPLRQLCLQVGETISRNIERISRENEVNFQSIIGSYITSNEASHLLFNSADDLLDHFKASYGVLRIGKEMIFMGEDLWPQECLETYLFLEKQSNRNIIISNDVERDMPGFYLGKEPQMTQRALLIPLCDDGSEFLALFRKSIVKEFNWAGQPEDDIKTKKTSVEPRKSFQSWTNQVVEESIPWEQDKEEAAVMLKLKLCKG